MCPGGGVKNGSRAQEEDICRRTTLYPTLLTHRYPLKPLELIYSPDIAILKTPEFKTMANKQHINVLTMAAIRRPALTKTNTYREHDKALMYDKVCMVLQTAYYHGIDTLVLGAWGCGAFQNPPHEVAAIFRHFLIDGPFKCVFRHVSFAILERGPEPLGNAFRSVFQK